MEIRRRVVDLNVFLDNRPGTVLMCFDELSKFFEIPKRGITVVVSDKRPRDSAYYELRRRRGGEANNGSALTWRNPGSTRGMTTPYILERTRQILGLTNLKFGEARFIWLEV